MLTRGHYFPRTDFDYEIAEDFIEPHEWDQALYKHENVFSGKTRKSSSPDIEKE
jgi:hypothetical protein